MRTEKAHIRLRIRAVWYGPSLFFDVLFSSIHLFFKRYEDFEQTEQRRRLICGLLIRIYDKVLFNVPTNTVV